MRIHNVREFQINDLNNIEFDLVLLSSGYESRATYLLQEYSLKSKERICFAFRNYARSISRVANDKIARNHQFRIFKANGGDSKDVLKVLNGKVGDLLNAVGNKKNSLKLLIDYSCMTRVWYAAILKYLVELESEVPLEIYFNYTIAKFSPAPKRPGKNEHVGPLKGYSSISLPDQPTALLIGLGYIQERAYGLTEYLDAEPYVFYTDDSGGNEFSQEVVKNNTQILKEVELANTYTYPVSKPVVTYNRLKDLCIDLVNDYRLIVAPCGPKPFSLVSLILSLELDNIDIWRISAGDSAKPVDKIPSGQHGLLKLELESY